MSTTIVSTNVIEQTYLGFFGLMSKRRIGKYQRKRALGVSPTANLNVRVEDQQNYRIEKVEMPLGQLCNHYAPTKPTLPH